MKVETQFCVLFLIFYCYCQISPFVPGFHTSLFSLHCMYLPERYFCLLEFTLGIEVESDVSCLLKFNIVEGKHNCNIEVGHVFLFMYFLQFYVYFLFGKFAIQDVHNFNITHKIVCEVIKEYFSCLILLNFFAFMSVYMDVLCL